MGVGVCARSVDRTIAIDFPTPAQAEIVCATLAVDRDLKADRSTRTLRTVDNQLVAEFSATEARFLRVAVNTFLDLALLSVRTLREFS